MDIKTMIESHQEMIDTMTASLKKRGFDQKLIHRPAEMYEDRAASVKARIEALDAARHDYVARIDGDIKTLKSELSTVEARIKTERKRVAAILKPSAAETSARRSTVKSPKKQPSARSSVKRPSKSAARKSSAKRSSKPPRRT